MKELSARQGSVQARVLLVGNDPDYFILHRLALVKELAASGVVMHVAVPHDAQDKRFWNLPFHLHRLPMVRGSINPLRELLAIVALARLVRKLRPDVLHNITIKPVVYGGLVARLMGTPRVVNAITGLGYVFTSNSTFAKLLRFSLVPALRFGCNRKNVTMLFENGDDRDVYCSLGITQPFRCRIVPSSGIDPESFVLRKHREGTVTVMLMGRMLWDKGVGEFVEAARCIRRKRANVRFVLVGATDSNPMSIPPSVLEDWQREGIVEYWGWRSDIAEILSETDVLCLPSYREGLPRSLLEGGASGLALVTTDVPGCRDAVLSGTSGILVPVADAMSLARALLDLIDNHERRSALGTAARADVIERFSVTAVAKKTRAIYDELLSAL